MKTISEFKGYRTRVEYDAETKQFLEQRVTDLLPIASTLAPEAADEEPPATATGDKCAS